MASDVTIANLALGFLGDGANVASLNPPDSSVQAQLCAKFYPVARNALLEMATWSFATRRVALAAVTNPSSTWQYAYAQPANVINTLAVLPAEALDDYESSCPRPDNYSYGFLPPPVALTYEPQPYATETDASGNLIILTNVENAVLRYTTLVTDANKFSPLFTEALAWKLAAMLAGPLLKGEAGAAEAKRCYQMFLTIETQAEASDANQRKVNVTPAPAWMVGR